MTRVPPRWQWPPRALAGVIGLMALAVLLAASVAIADRLLVSARLDLTAGRTLSLSPGSRQIVADLRAPVTLKLYLSRDLPRLAPGLAAHADRVRTLLAEYAALSDGRVRLQVYDPEPFGEVEDRALAAGLQSVSTVAGQEPVYFGLVGNSLLDDQRTIPFFAADRARFAEYDISRLIHDLGNPQRPVVGVLSPLPLDGDSARLMRGLPGGAPWISMIQLRDAFAVRRVPLDTAAIEPDVQVLVTAGTRDLTPATLRAIEQFVLRGGRLLAFVDPHSEARASDPDVDPADAAAMASDLGPLLAGWGIGFDPATVTGDLDGAWRVRARPDAGSGPSIDYVPWFNVRAGIAREDPATANLVQLGFAAPGALTRLSGGTLAMTTIVQTSARAGAIPRAKVTGQPDPAAILAAFHGDGARVLAARFRGPLRATRPVQAGDLVDSLGPVDIAVVADTDVLDDRFWVRVEDVLGRPQAVPFSDNGAFVVNLVGTLAGGDALLALRARGDGLRPMTRLDALRDAAEATYRAGEQALRAHLDATAQKLAALRTSRDSEDAAIDALAADVTATRAGLRTVQANLRRETDAIGTRLRFVDVALMPLLLVAGAGGLMIERRRRAA